MYDIWKGNRIMTLMEAVRKVKPVDQAVRNKAKEHWDRVAKPLGSLGVLEEDIVRIAAALGRVEVSLNPKAIVVMCGDNGIVKEGVTQTGQEVTAIVAGNMAQGKSCVCLMAKQAGADVIPVDVGMASQRAIPGVLDRKIACGTRDFLEGPAMAREETVRAMETGIEIACLLKDRGYELAGSGEMGIGNTTTSSAVLSVLLDREPEAVTGRGAGLSTKGYSRKVQVIKEGIRIHSPRREDPVDVLSKVGGFDLAALAGFYIGCGACGLPVVLDGLITGAAALAAVGVCPEAGGYLLASHVSAEPAGAMVLEALGLRPAIHADMCLGEGTGAASLFPLLDMAAAVYTQMSSFDDIHVEQYEHYRR